MASGATSPKRGRAERLSELEGAVLGYIWKHGPCTAYSVRKIIGDSPSSHWSGSAGAIYPLLDRLHRRRLIASRHTPTGNRSAWLVSLAPKGRTLLNAWLAPALDRDILSMAADPLRTRLFFLAA